MRPTRDNPDPDAQTDLPQQLRDALRATVPMPLTTRVDAAIGAAARRRLRPAGPLRLRWVRLAGLAAAASILLALLTTPHWPTAPAHVSDVSDVNRDGRIDIRDALALARRIEDGGVLASNWDFTGDA